MSHPKLTSVEITQRGQAIYHDQLRTVVETPDHIGKLISINVETGDYEIGEDLVSTSRQLQARQADAAAIPNSKRAYAISSDRTT